MEVKTRLEKYKHIINSLPNRGAILKPSDFAEKKRRLTSDVSTIQGMFRYSRTPYLKEIVDALSPDDPAKIISVMKASQIGFTEGVLVNGILWIIPNEPGNILALSATDELSREMVEQRLEQGIKSVGIDHLIRPNTVRKRNQRTGNTSKSKEYAGGRAFFGGIGNIDKLSRQRSIKYGFFDDWDAAPIIDKEQGNLFDLLQQRFSTSARQMKQFYISTPETRPSNIEKVYLRGDQRKWHVPCPLCKEYIELKWFDTDENGKQIGIYFEKDEKSGELIEESVGYICQKCHGFFKEKHKYDMNLAGRWVPTAKPERPTYRSYYINALYNAPHQYNWTDYVFKWLDIYKGGYESGASKKVFYNQVLGLPWEAKRKDMKAAKLSQNTRNYDIGTIPVAQSREDGNGEIVLITLACDLNGTIDDARLDYDIWAHSETGSVYSVDAGSIGTYYPKRKKEGRTKWTYRNEKPDNVWDILYNQIIKKDYVTDEGETRRITVSGIDCGYYTHYAYTFLDQHKGEMIMGIKGRANEKGIKAGADTKIYKPSQERGNLYIIETDMLKDELSEKLNLHWNKENNQPAGFMNFPIPGNNKYTVSGYFAQYEAEHKIIEENEDGEAIGWKWQKKYQTAQNHFFDTAVYNYALKYIFSQMVCYEIEKKKHATWADYVELAKQWL
jgi:phage terminase large subunit GpA-like protein